MLCGAARCGPSRESGRACACDMDGWHDVWTLTDAGGLVQPGGGGGRAVDERGAESGHGGGRGGVDDGGGRGWRDDGGERQERIGREAGEGDGSAGGESEMDLFRATGEGFWSFSSESPQPPPRFPSSPSLSSFRPLSVLPSSLLLRVRLLPVLVQSLASPSIQPGTSTVTPLVPLPA